MNPAVHLFCKLQAGILDGQFAGMGNNHTKGAAYLAKVYTMNWALGVQHLCWWVPVLSRLSQPACRLLQATIACSSLQAVLGTAAESFFMLYAGAMWARCVANQI